MHMPGDCGPTYRTGGPTYRPRVWVTGLIHGYETNSYKRALREDIPASLSRIMYPSNHLKSQLPNKIDDLLLTITD